MPRAGAFQRTTSGFSKAIEQTAAYAVEPRYPGHAAEPGTRKTTLFARSVQGPIDQTGPPQFRREAAWLNAKLQRTMSEFESPAR